MRPADVDLATMLADAHLDNPVMTASGCAAAGQELHQFFDVADLGAVVTKSIMRDPRSGRATPRMAETPSGMLNSIGLQGPGIDAFLARDLPWLLQHDARPIVSIAGSSLGEYAELARRVGNSPGVAAIEVNISCPNVENRGLVFACDPVQASRVLSVVRRDTPRGVPVFAKLSPDVTSIVEIAGAVLEAGADGARHDQYPAGPRTSTSTPCARPLGGVTGRPFRSGCAPGRGARRLAGGAARFPGRPSSASAASEPGRTRWSSWRPVRVRSRSGP